LHGTRSRCDRVAGAGGVEFGSTRRLRTCRQGESEAAVPDPAATRGSWGPPRGDLGRRGRSRLAGRVPPEQDDAACSGAPRPRRSLRGSRRPRPRVFPNLTGWGLPNAAIAVEVALQAPALNKLVELQRRVLAMRQAFQVPFLRAGAPWGTGMRFFLLMSPLYAGSGGIRSPGLLADAARHQPDQDRAPR